MNYKNLLLTIFPFITSISFSQTNDDFIYAKMETENALLLRKESPDSIQIISSKENFSAIYFHPAISEKLHHKFAHGHGFIYQSSKQEALNSLSDSKVLKRAIPYNYSITEGNFITTALDDVDVHEIEKNIVLLENFKTRYHTRPEANEAVLKMKEVWEQLISQYNRNDISVQLISHVNTPMNSLILTINGNEHKDEHIIIGGHIDSTVGWNQNKSFAPGADDNASGIATITEILRVLLKNNFKPQRTVEIMAYAAEEIGLIGSKEIAEKYKTENKNVIGYIQFDMTNYKGSTNDVVLMTDEYCDANLNNFLMQLMDTYNKTGLHQFTYDTSACGYGCSDHASWANNGFSATLPFEAKMDEDNPNIHTINDTYSFLGNTSTHAAKFTKLGIEYVVEAAKISTLGTDNLNKDSAKIYVSNKMLYYKFNNNQTGSFYIVDASGKRIKTENKKLSSGDIDLSNLNKGFYIAIFTIDKGNSISHKFLIK